ncbi:MAG TPA: ATP-grasp domain-containing protein [Candidatus Norongarragalinales archaeon]|nr:ATP-grasp domain-containing protein [Candidatus Norongarragalinales archaeon]
MNNSVLVTDASKRASLAAIRSLGRRGVRVAALDPSRFAAGFLSRYCSEKILCPNPQQNPAGFLKTVEKELSTGKYDVFLPVHDFSLIPVLKNKDKLEKHAAIPFVDFETFEKTADKSITQGIASKAGVRTPRSFYPSSLLQVERLSDKLDYPVVVKARSQTQAGDGKATTAYVSAKSYCHNPRELLAQFDLVFKKTGVAPIIQEYVAGKGVGVAALFNKGKPRALFSYKRVREYPISGGPSTLRESTDDAFLKKQAEKILRALKWHGLAMVEFKQPAKGEAAFLEVNGRFWGSVQLAVSSGVDFPFLLYKMAVDGDVAPVKKYAVGVKQKWLMPGDLLHYAQKLRFSKGKLGVASEFASSLLLEKCYEDYFDPRDPLPAFGALGTSLKYLKDFILKKRSLEGEYVA